MVADSDGRHALSGNLLDERLDSSGTIQHGEFGVYVKVDE
jgi:hypothetical protein